MKRTLFRFTRFDEFLDMLTVHSPYGREALVSPKYYRNSRDLEEWYDGVELLAAFIRGNKARKDRVEYHLRRLPEIPPADEGAFVPDDLFLFKRFLSNFRALSDLLPEAVLERFSLRFSLEELYGLLTADGCEESFQISEAFSGILAGIRKELKEQDLRVAALRGERLEEISRKTGLDFSYRDFILIDISAVPDMPPDLIYRESYDSGNFILRPVMPGEYYRLLREREGLAEAEKGEMGRIAGELSGAIEEVHGTFEGYTAAVSRFEQAWITASAALTYDMIRPVLIPPGKGLTLEEARFLPLARDCAERGVEYQSLSFAPESRISVIRGSNMGGKTVLLRSTGFFQVLVQHGFFVPARTCSLPLFDSVSTVAGVPGEREARGLSSYALEILSLVEALGTEGEQRLFLIDEFGSTTTSDEARALNEALIEIMDRGGITALVATHISDLRVPEDVSLYRMKGLRREGLLELVDSSSPGTLDERIRLINGHMIYTAEPETRSKDMSDAVVIARALGLDTTITDLAEQRLGLDNE